MQQGDPLSDVLRAIRLRGAVFYYVSYGRDWAAEAPAAHEIAAAVMPGAEHVMEYHVITRGRGWAGIVGKAPVRIQAGDVIMFPHGDAHVMSSNPALKPTRIDRDWVYEHRNDPRPIPVNYHGNGRVSVDAPLADAETNVVCGFFGCDLRPFNPLIASLPPVLHLPALPGQDWNVQLIDQAVRASQSNNPGSRALLERMSEMMFVDAVRRYAEKIPESMGGWLRAVHDRQIGRALALLHTHPGREWSVDLLAREVAMSRSAFYARFVQLLGQPPMHYLAGWRMQIAANMLRQRERSVASIALESGYESEAAFTRAFKRHMGLPPGTWRRAQLHRTGAAGAST